MAKISLIGVDLAKEGLEFTFVEPLKGCTECRIKNVCFNLEPGTSYRITKVREKENPCFVFNKDKVNTIEVEPLDEFLNAQNGMKLQEGSTIKATSLECKQFTCPNIEVCNLIHIKEGRKARINSIGEKVDCPKGLDLRKVTVSFK